MAKIEVEAVVAKIFYNGKAASLVENYKGIDGQVFTRRYTAWFDEPVKFEEGAVGKFSGNLSVKIEKWTDAEGNPKLDQSGQQGQSARISINNTEFDGFGTVRNAPLSPEAFADAGWTEISADETPF
jgi:hypothetical protein